MVTGVWELQLWFSEAGHLFLTSGRCQGESSSLLLCDLSHIRVRSYLCCEGRLRES